MADLVESFPVCPGVLVDVNLARKIVAGRKANARIELREFDGLVRRGYAGINRYHYRHRELKKEPVLVVTIAGITVLVDGWHRAMRAFRMDGKKRLAAIRLTDAEFRRVSFRPDRKLKKWKKR